MPARFSTRSILLTLIVVGFLLRLGMALRTGIAEPPVSDGIEFDTYAWNVAQGRGYRGMSADVSDRDHLTAYRPPVPSLVWAALYRVFGHRYDVVRITHCLIGAGTIALVFGVGRLAFSERIGLWAAGAFTVYPLAIFSVTWMEAETISLALFMGYILVSLQFAQRPRLWPALVAGILLGLTLLARGSAVFMFPLAGLWVVWQFRKNWREMALALLIPAAAVLTLVPWIVRNYRIFHRFIPISTMGGSALLQANNRIVVTDPLYFGYTVWDTKIPEYADALRAPNDEWERDHVAQELAVQWLKDNKDKWGFLVAQKLKRAFTPFLQSHAPALYRWTNLLTWGPVLVLFALSFFPTWIQHLRTANGGWLIHMAILHFVANTVIFHGLLRYRFSIEPLCLILAAVSVEFVWNKLRPSS